jgi:hypothetical protein
MPTDTLRAISVSPYFSDDETIKLVKFPGFSESGTDPTDAKLFVDLAVFLGSRWVSFRGLNARYCAHIDCSGRIAEQIQSIIYMHPMTDGGLTVADAECYARDVERNVRMLLEITGDAIRNVIIVTTKWGRIPHSDRESKETDLRNRLMQFYQGPFIRHDGTKWSALNILNFANQKIPQLLDLQNEVTLIGPADTTAGVVLSSYISGLNSSKREERTRLRAENRTAKRANRNDKVKELTAALEQLEVTLGRLEEEDVELNAPVDCEKTAGDNAALERAIEERHDWATKDWKAEYDKLVIENQASKVRSLTDPRLRSDMIGQQRTGRRNMTS